METPIFGTYPGSFLAACRFEVKVPLRCHLRSDSQPYTNWEMDQAQGMLDNNGNCWKIMENHDKNWKNDPQCWKMMKVAENHEPEKLET